MAKNVRQIRIDQDLWDELGAVAAHWRTTRSELIRSCIAWVTGQPDARPPAQMRRPDRDA